MSDYLGDLYPELRKKLQKQPFADLPTPISQCELTISGRKIPVAIKHDDQSNARYGGNKIRKLEYLLGRAKSRGAERLATFGATGSNHALATAVVARDNKLGCTCFLAHQKRSPAVERTLLAHLRLGTELVYLGGRADRLALFRRYLQGRRTWVIPLGGSCWLGAVGFVNAGLELKAQIDAGELEAPARIYIANGTMGSVAGMALGLRLAGLDTEIHAVRVAHNRFTNRMVLERLIRKTATLMHAYDASFPAQLAEQAEVVWRDEFYAGGYAIADESTEAAVRFANENMGLTLDTTYTGKAIAALLSDVRNDQADGPILFWNTYNSQPVSDLGDPDIDFSHLPEAFESYISGNGKKGV